MTFRTPIARGLVLVTALTISAQAYAAYDASHPSVRAVLKLTPEGDRATPEMQQEAIRILRNRLTGLVFEEPEVRPLGDSRITVTMPLVPGRTIPEVKEALLKAIRPTRLELIWLKDVQRPATEPDASEPFVLLDDLGIRDTKTGKTLSEKQVRERILYADPKAVILTGAELKPGGARAEILHGQPTVHLAFTAEGAKRLAAFTRGHIGSYLGVVLDGALLQAPVVKDAIPNGVAVITGIWSNVEEATELAVLINAGALPADVKLESVKLWQPGDDGPD